MLIGVSILDPSISPIGMMDLGLSGGLTYNVHGVAMAPWATHHYAVVCHVCGYLLMLHIHGPNHEFHGSHLVFHRGPDHLVVAVDHSRTPPNWGPRRVQKGSIWGVQTAWSPGIHLFLIQNTPFWVQNRGFVYRPSEGLISDPRVQNPDPSESYPFGVFLTLKMDDLETPDRPVDPWDCKWPPSLHPRFVFGFVTCTLQIHAFGVQIWGPKWVKTWVPADPEMSTVGRRTGSQIGSQMGSQMGSGSGRPI